MRKITWTLAILATVALLAAGCAQLSQPSSGGNLSQANVGNVSLTKPTPPVPAVASIKIVHPIQGEQYPGLPPTQGPAFGQILLSLQWTGTSCISVTIDGSPFIQPWCIPGPIQAYSTPFNEPAPGTHTIRAAAMVQNGSQWAELPGVSDTVTFYVDNVLAPTNWVDDSSLTPFPMPTIPPVVYAGPIWLPFPPELTSHQLYFGGACGPQQIVLSAQAKDPKGIKVLVFFFRLKDPATGEETPWSEGTAMNAAGTGRYSLTMLGSSLKSAFPQAIVEYQLVAQLGDGTSDHSPVMTDLSLSRCGAGSGATVIPYAPRPFNPPTQTPIAPY